MHKRANNTDKVLDDVKMQIVSRFRQIPGRDVISREVLVVVVVVVGGGGGQYMFSLPEGTPLYKPDRYVPAPKGRVLRRFGLKMGIDFSHF